MERLDGVRVTYIPECDEVEFVWEVGNEAWMNAGLMRKVDVVAYFQVNDFAHQGRRTILLRFEQTVLQLQLAHLVVELQHKLLSVAQYQSIGFWGVHKVVQRFL